MQKKKLYFLYPYYRDSIKFSFKDLSDKEAQLKDWMINENGDYSAGRYYFSLLFYVLDSLYNDFELYEGETYKEYGQYFYAKEEADRVWDFMQFFNSLLNEIGDEQSNDAYLKHPEWPRIWSWSAEIFKMMDDNDKKYDFSYNLGLFNDKENFKEWCEYFKKNKAPESWFPK